MSSQPAPDSQVASRLEPGARSLEPAAPAAIREAVGGSWVERADGWWLRLAPGQVRAAARAVLEGQGRFAAVVARPAAGGLRLSWHWDAGGTLLSVDTVLAAGEKVPSIADLYPGADWGERETRDYYGVEFEGRSDTPPLMLREGDAPGVLLPPPQPGSAGQRKSGDERQGNRP